MFQKIRRLFRNPRISLALAGGGCKAFFGLGVVSVLKSKGYSFYQAAGTSAGSAMLLGGLAGEADPIVEYFCEITGRNPANFHFSRILGGRRPFPHERMYRKTIATFMDIKKIQALPEEILINALQLPSHLNAADRMKLVARIVRAFRQEERLEAQGIYRPHMRQVARLAGLRETLFSKADLSSPEMVENIILASSSVPPMVSFQKIGSDYYLDGGITHNLPAVFFQPCDLVIAIYYLEQTRHFYELTGHHKEQPVLYCRPHGRLPITTWDYANPEGVRKTYRMGLQAGEFLLEQLARYGFG
ncbi:MAG: patatin-like phospholipase family protein [Spirochaetales bacterium]|nr:patatin-like phospholipase family protein [Spirochaetales bacterium]